MPYLLDHDCAGSKYGSVRGGWTLGEYSVLFSELNKKSKAKKRSIPDESADLGPDVYQKASTNNVIVTYRHSNKFQRRDAPEITCGSGKHSVAVDQYMEKVKHFCDQVGDSAMYHTNPPTQYFAVSPTDEKHSDYHSPFVFLKCRSNLLVGWFSGSEIDARLIFSQLKQR